MIDYLSDIAFIQVLDENHIFHPIIAARQKFTGAFVFLNGFVQTIVRDKRCYIFISVLQRDDDVGIHVLQINGIVVIVHINQVDIGYFQFQ